MTIFASKNIRHDQSVLRILEDASLQPPESPGFFNSLNFRMFYNNHEFHELN